MQNTLSELSDKKTRYHLIDALRGFALLNMLAFHLLYDIYMIYGLDSGWFFQPLAVVWERFICVSFILISGISFNFSRRAYRRGIILNLFGFAITAVTVLAIPGQAIWFGILNLLGCAMLILQPLREYLEKIKPIIGFLTSLLIFALCCGVPQRYIGFFGFKIFDLPDALYSFKWLSFLGFKSADFASADFFPIIPWLFLFAAGFFLWRVIENAGAQQIFTLKIPVLGTIGRYSLYIYLAHQPLIMGVLMLVFGLP